MVRSTPRDFFMYLLSTVALYLTVLSSLVLLFQYINAALPDPANPNWGLAGQVRWFVAMMIVVFPVFIWTTRTLRKERDAMPEKGELKVRKWLVYLTLFLAAVLIIGDLIALIYNFLNGELSVRFYLKIFAVLVVGSAVFGYFFYDLRRKPGESAKPLSLISWSAVVAALVIIVAGFFVVGSPMKQRAIRLDQQKLEELRNLRYPIEQYWAAKNSLPETLEDIRSLTSAEMMVDPENGKQYEYRRVADLRYELCADFNLTSADAEQYEYGNVIREPDGFTWEHGAGRQCFERSIDPELVNQQFPKVLR